MLFFGFISIESGFFELSDFNSAAWLVFFQPPILPFITSNSLERESFASSDFSNFLRNAVSTLQYPRL